MSDMKGKMNFCFFLSSCLLREKHKEFILTCNRLGHRKIGTTKRPEPLSPPSKIKLGKFLSFSNLPNSSKWAVSVRIPINNFFLTHHKTVIMDITSSYTTKKAPKRKVWGPKRKGQGRGKGAAKFTGGGV